ncbi:FUSC family protein [Blautia sp. RD014234]|nr:FUSC family protein [Blautia parvula]
MRFALRLSLVLSLSFLICRLLDISHSYWLPLNAFLLVQPMYEESTRRLKNRVIGTFLGSTFVFLC